MRVTIHGKQTSETMDIHVDRSHTVGSIIQIILAIHPWLYQEIPPGRDRNSLEQVMTVRTADQPALMFDDSVENDVELEITFHDIVES